MTAHTYDSSYQALALALALTTSFLKKNPYSNSVITPITLTPRLTLSTYPIYLPTPTPNPNPNQHANANPNPNPNSGPNANPDPYHDPLI